MKALEAKLLLKAIENSDYQPTQSEMGFLALMQDKVDSEFTLSNEQGQKLYEIYRKAQG